MCLNILSSLNTLAQNMSLHIVTLRQIVKSDHFSKVDRTAICNRGGAVKKQKQKRRLKTPYSRLFNLTNILASTDIDYIGSMISFFRFPPNVRRYRIFPNKFQMETPIHCIFFSGLHRINVG